MHLARIKQQSIGAETDGGGGSGRAQFAPSPSSAKLLPAWHATHVGQMVGNALVAIDAGFLTREQETLVGHRCARRLLGDVHRLGAMAVPTLQGIVGLEPRPFM